MLNKVIFGFLILGSLLTGLFLILQLMFDINSYSEFYIPLELTLITFFAFVFTTFLYLGLRDSGHSKLLILGGSVIAPFVLVWKIITSLFFPSNKEIYGDILKPFETKTVKRKNK